MSSVASHRQTQRPNTSPSSVSSNRVGLHTASPSTVSSHSRCSCSRRVTDIRAFSGFYSDGDVDDVVAMETRQQLQRSLRSTTSEGGAFRRVLPSRLVFHQRSRSNGTIGIAPTPRDCDVTGTKDHSPELGEWTKEANGEVETRRKGQERRDWLAGQTQHRGQGEWPNGVMANGSLNKDRLDVELAGQRTGHEASDWLKAARHGTSDWVSGVVAEAHQTGQRRRRGRQVLSVVKSGAGLRAISETGNTCRPADVTSSLAADVSHPVIRGLYRQPLAAPASPRSASLASSSSSSVASVSAAETARDGAASDDDSLSKHSV